MEVECLLNTRDVLVATICLHKMEAKDSSKNLEETKNDVSYEYNYHGCSNRWVGGVIS